MKTKIAYLAALALAAAGCFKETAYRTAYIIKPLVQNTSGDVLLPLSEVRAYAFDADTSAWFVASYEDALAGVITARSNPSQQRSDASAVGQAETAEGLEGRIRLDLEQESQLVVVADAEHRLYAYSQQSIGLNLPQTYVTLIFRPYREGRSYTEGAWSFRNDFYVIPDQIVCTVAAYTQQQEGDEPEPIEASTSALRAYAFAADTTLWRIASYTDALNGVITSKSDSLQTRENPNFTAYPEEGFFRMTVTSPQLMVVVVDRVNGLYAYSQQTVDLTGGPVTFGPTFRRWRREYLYVDQGWRIVDEAWLDASPGEPEEPGEEPGEEPEDKPGDDSGDPSATPDAARAGRSPLNPAAR